MLVDFPFDGDLVLTDDTSISGVVRGSLRVAGGITTIEKSGLIARNVVVDGGSVRVYGTVAGNVVSLDGEAAVFGAVRGVVRGSDESIVFGPDARIGPANVRVDVPAGRPIDIRFQPTTADPTVVPVMSGLRWRLADVRRSLQWRIWRPSFSWRVVSMIAVAALFLGAGGLAVNALVDDPPRTSVAVLGSTETATSADARSAASPTTDGIETPAVARSDSPAVAELRRALNGLTIVDSPQSAIEFGPSLYAFVDGDEDCRTTDVDVAIAASATAVRYSLNGCQIVDGSWIDVWSGEVIDADDGFVVEPIVPFAEVHRSGGSALSPLERFALANETGTGDLFVVSADTSAARSDAGPDAWAPVTSASCAYAGAWIDKKARWSLSATTAEVVALGEFLDRCGDGDHVFDTLES